MADRGVLGGRVPCQSHNHTVPNDPSPTTLRGVYVRVDARRKEEEERRNEKGRGVSIGSVVEAWGLNLHVLESPTMSWLYSTVTEGTPVTVTGSLAFCCGCWAGGGRGGDEAVEFEGGGGRECTWY